MIVYYDGVCVFCSSWVKFVVSCDRKKRVKFCTLQSDSATHIRNSGHVNADDIESIVLELDDGTLLTKSTASLSVFRYLGFPANLLSVLLIIPRMLRDYVYDYIGKRRYKIFGKYDSCPLPDPAIKDRFIF